MPSRDNQLMSYLTFNTNKVFMLVGTNKKDLNNLKFSSLLFWVFCQKRLSLSKSYCEPQSILKVLCFSESPS